MTLQEFKNIYFPKCNVLEVLDPDKAKEMLNSKMSCCWANGVVDGTGWALLSQPSPEKEGDKKEVLVCRQELVA